MDARAADDPKPGVAVDRPGDRVSADTAPKANPGAGRTLQRELAVRLRWLRRRASTGVAALGRHLEHASILSDVHEDGRLSGRYIFMAVMACAIAILGLLLSSPAVIIGAMLISPLMGPIMLLGFSLCTLDYPSMRRALVSLGAGIGAALAISTLIVLVSPLREATPEILARTRPNLFDLLVAIFSGLAGGYSVIHRKGATIVGVAIATALMPPLAVIGFGIATGSAGIAGGAFFLFMTNLLAIALTVTGLAWLHGFAALHNQSVMRWQTALVLIVFGGLSLPLGFALRDIAYEARVVNTVRAMALAPFEGHKAEVSSLSVNFPSGLPIQVQQTVITHAIVSGAEVQLSLDFERALGRPVELQLNQILVDETRALSADDVMRLAQSSLAPLQSQIAAMDRRQKTEADIRNAAPFRTVAVNVDAGGRTAAIVAAGSQAISLAAFREMESEVNAKFPGWTIRVIPPVALIPPVPFESGSNSLSDEGAAAVDLAIWALSRWGVGSVEVTGNASALGGGSAASNRRIALARAEAVAERLGAAGVTAEAISGFGQPNQQQLERQQGIARFQSAMINPRD